MRGSSVRHSTQHSRSARSGLVAALAVAATLVGGCKKERPKYVPGVAKAVLGVNMAEVKTAIAARLDSSKAPSWVPAAEWKRVKAVYAVYGDAPLWLEPDGVKERAEALLKAIEEAPTHALTTNAYPLDSIRTVVNTEHLTKTKTAQALADADVLLTAAYAAYASDMLIGQVDPKTVSQAWHIKAQPKEVDSALVRTLQSPSMAEGLAEMAPRDSGYQVLRDAYAHYQKLADAGGWPAVPATGATRFTALQQRLAAEGFVTDSAPAPATTPATGAAAATVTLAELAPALKRFQERHGLTVSGKLSPATMAALNTTAAERVQQIASNLERHRWLPRSLGTRYVLVNVPAFRLEAFDSGQKTLEMKVVVGAEYEGRSTPVFSDSMEFVVFRPYWNVTDMIAANEIFPKAAADPGYLERNNYETYMEGGKRRVRQRPGDKNALGLVKFLFPNDFAIYLHDTQEKALFAKDDRGASHGCIRLEKPDKMAEWALGWPADRVQAAMHGSDNRSITLDRKIPVYIVYFTAYARDGQLYFSGDLYGRDDALESEVGDSASARPDSGRS
jgi:murein L,D-transpeptidase YcbB/YkuD